MKPISRALISLAASFAILPTGVLLAQVSYDYRPGASLAEMKTFAFRDAEPSQSSERATTYDSPLVDERTRTAVAAELGRRGMKEDVDNPDVYVRLTRTFAKEYSVYNAGWGWGGWPGYGYGYGWGPYGYGYAGWYGWGGGGPWYTYETTVGTLAIDFEDAHTGQLLWRGVGERDVHNHSKPESRQAHTNHEVRHIMKKLKTPTLMASR